MKKKILIFLIILLASVLRLWKIADYPSGLNADEAAIGYNDYSLLQTGKDEHGESFPIHFKSFEDYKPGGYFYLVLPFVKIIGLNELAVRLPSAILGILSVYLIYVLVKELFPDERKFSVGEIAALLLAISPWHLQYSRGGWEVNAATTFIILGLVLFFKGLKNSKLFVFSIIAFVFSLYTYHSARIIVPLMGIFLILFFYKTLLKNIKWVFISGLIGFLICLPLLFSFFSKAGVSRFSGVGLFSQSGPEWRANELRGEHDHWNSLDSKILHNKIVYYSISFVSNYLDHFRGDFLFINGDVIERNRIPETGQLYLIEFPLILLGIIYLLRSRPKNYQFILFWLGIAPIAAALTFQTPHALRAQNMVISLEIISAFGLWQILEWVKSRKRYISVFLNCLIILILVWSLGRYLHQYYVHYPQTYPAAWEYGFKEAVNYVKPIEKDYEKIYITDKYDQPYILFLFYLQYPPSIFQKEVILTPRDRFGFSTVKDFGRYHFDPIVWDLIKDEKNTLVLGTGEEIPDSANIIHTVYFPNGKPAFKIAKL